MWRVYCTLLYSVHIVIGQLHLSLLSLCSVAWVQGQVSLHGWQCVWLGLSDSQRSWLYPWQGYVAQRYQAFKVSMYVYIHAWWHVCLWYACVYMCVVCGICVCCTMYLCVFVCVWMCGCVALCICVYVCVFVCVCGVCGEHVCMCVCVCVWVLSETIPVWFSAWSPYQSLWKRTCTQ